MQSRRMGARSLVICTIGIALSMVVAGTASAAELNAAELEGSVNNVTVAQGSTATFSLSVTSTGLIRCAATPSTPATATFATHYAVGPAGGISVGTGTAIASFWADPNCNVTWTGHPTPQIITGTISADRDAPLGASSLRLRPQLSTPFGSGEALLDRVSTLMTFTVVEPADATPPTIACDGPLGTAGAGAWFTSPVGFSCEATDDESGLADAADATFSLTTTGEGSASTAGRAVEDRAGNVATAGPFGPYDVDLSDPTVAIDEPADGAVYLLGQHVTPSWRCDDAVSGIASCEAVGALDTSGVGPGAVTVTAIDRAGRRTSLTRTFSVVYDVTGPVVHGRAVPSAGGAVPVWWTATAAAATAYVGATATLVDCVSGNAIGSPEPIWAPGKSAPSFDDGTFRLVVKTEPSWAGQCVELGIRLDDGTARALTLRLR